MTDEIRSEAEAEAQRIIDEAEEQRDEILEDAKQEKQELLQEAEEEAEQEIEALRKKEISSARMRARKMKQEARQDVLEDVFQRFRDRVADMEEDDEQDLLEAALDDLSGEIDIGTVHTRAANEAVAEDYGDFAEEDVRGAIGESEDGSRRFDLTFDTVMEQTIKEHRKDVSQVLFG